MSVTYVEAPQEYEGPGPSVFVAGTITGAPDWQQDIARFLRDEEVALLNPRRANFPIGDPKAAPAQIAWEHRHLRRADAILFWFARETLAPIVLYELGAWSMTPKPIFVGAHPEYPRRQDVEIQTALARPDAVIVDVGLPGGEDGIELTRKLCDEFPETVVLILSAHEEPEYARRAAEAGAMGYVLKSDAVDNLRSALRNAFKGRRTFDGDA